ncbi:MAG: DUF1902 domain-containing protein [Defluviitaleaceae bacterium]|nr:DUF1902 domain-containing protein [Defluviitaleaceae bacterium]
MKTYTVKMIYDNGCWISSTGAPLCLVLEADSYDKLVKRVCLAAPEMLELNTGYTGPFKLNFVTEHSETLPEAV